MDSALFRKGETMLLLLLLKGETVMDSVMGQGSGDQAWTRGGGGLSRILGKRTVGPRQYSVGPRQCSEYSFMYDEASTLAALAW
jgi:hypothetical protein